MSEILKSRERRNLEMALSRTPPDVHTNGHNITTSKDIPKGRCKLNENNHGVVLSLSLPKRSNNDLDPDGLRNTIERGRVNFSELGGGHHITTSNDIPQGRYKPYENNHGVVLSEILPKRSNNDLDSDGLRNTIERGRVNFSKLGENHGTVLKIPEYTEDRIFEDELELSVIPLKQQVTTDTNSDSF